MRRICRAASFAALLAVAVSPAMVRADPLVHMAWDDCGAAGSATRTFACNTNLGVEQLYVSFVPPAGITAFNALEGDIRLWAFGTSYPPVIPSYWGVGSGQCRASSVSLTFFGSGPFTCANPWPTSAAGGAVMESTFSSNFQPRIRCIAAVPAGDEQSLDPSIEYYGFRLVFNHRKSTGLGACDGCSTPIGLELRGLRIDQSPSGTAPYDFETGRNSGVFQTVNWQCEGAPAIYEDVSHGGVHTWAIAGWDFPGCVTPAQRRTWGSIKSLYR